jgi:hypothetical protein
LLTPLAFVSFLPAWMIRALENLDGDNTVRDMVIFCFAPGQLEREYPCMRAHREERLRCLTSEQIGVVRTFVDFVANRERSRFVRQEALKVLDALRGFRDL